MISKVGGMSSIITFDNKSNLGFWNVNLVINFTVIEPDILFLLRLNPSSALGCNGNSIVPFGGCSNISLVSTISPKKSPSLKKSLSHTSIYIDFMSYLASLRQIKNFSLFHWGCDVDFLTLVSPQFSPFHLIYSMQGMKGKLRFLLRCYVGLCY